MSTGPAAPIALEYSIADVFTDTALAGNPVAVVTDSIGLPTERMQAIAREFNLSETTFVQRRPVAVEQAEGVRVRIFTTQRRASVRGTSNIRHGERAEDQCAGDGTWRHHHA